MLATAILTCSMPELCSTDAALVEEASASADVLRAQTGQLAAAIAVFTLPQA